MANDFYVCQSTQECLLNGIMCLMNISMGAVRLYRNSVLRLLSHETIARLELVRVDLPARREIEFPGNEIKHLFFLEAGAASMTTTFLDGDQVEVALCGNEAVLGSSYLLGTRRSLNRVYMQVPGFGYSTKTALAAQEFRRSERFHDLILRYTQTQFIQSAQTAGCNVHHSVEQRLARWILLCLDRVGGPIEITQDFIAMMLGNQRSSVSAEAAKLQKLGLIEYTRGRIVVSDRAGLELRACECYATVRNDLEHYTDDDWDLERFKVGDRSTLAGNAGSDPLLSSEQL